MVPLATIRELFAYNYWARDRQLEACGKLSTEQFLRPMGNSFSSLRDTLAHLLGAEWIWQERWWGRSPKALPGTEYPNLAAIQEAWHPVEQGVRDYLGQLSEEKLVGRFTYMNTKGETWTYPVWRSMLHVANHQTYHRGQVTMFLRQLGNTPPSLDLMAADMQGALDEIGRQRYLKQSV
jgi:uncharacterized damage-inducible protein DinB